MALLVSKTTNGFEIFKKNTDGNPVGESLGTFASEFEAHTKCYEMDDDYTYVPWGVTTLEEAFESDDAQKQANEVRRVARMYRQLTDNIIGSSEVKNKGAAVKKLAGEFADWLDSLGAPKSDNKKSIGTTTGSTASTVTISEVVAANSGGVYSPPVSDPKALKFVPNSTDRIGAYAVLWGDETKKDLDGEFFTEKTEELTKIFDAVGKLPLLYQHTADAVLKTHVLGIVDTLKTDSVGLWYEAQLLMSSQYDEWVKKLIEGGKLKTSSQTFPNAKSKIDETGEITRWPIIEITATPTPAEYRMPPLQVLKSAYAAMDCGEKFDCAISQYVESNDQGAVKARLLLDQTRLQLELVD
jgi:phage head maturation protease